MLRVPCLQKNAKHTLGIDLRRTYSLYVLKQIKQILIFRFLWELFYTKFKHFAYKRSVASFAYCNVYVAICGAKLLKCSGKAFELNDILPDYKHIDRIWGFDMYFSGN
jgi:hypothetical protein